MSRPVIFKLKSFQPIVFKVFVIKAVFLGIMVPDLTGYFLLMAIIICRPVLFMDILFLFIFHLLGLIPRINTWRNMILESFISWHVLVYCWTIHSDDISFIGRFYSSHPIILLLLAALISVLAYIAMDACGRFLCSLYHKTSRMLPSWKKFVGDSYDIMNAFIKKDLTLLSRVLLAFCLIYTLVMIGQKAITEILNTDTPNILITLLCYVSPVCVLFLHFANHRFKLDVSKFEVVFFVCAAIFLICATITSIDSAYKVADNTDKLVVAGSCARQDNMASEAGNWMISFLIVFFSIFLIHIHKILSNGYGLMNGMFEE